jgi:acetolactate synthase small subunit
MFRPDRLSVSGASASDDSSANQSIAAFFCFSIDVTPDPGAMARVLEQFAKRGLVPTRWHSDVIESDAMQIDIQIVGLSAGLGQDIARCLRSIVGVHSVLTAGKTGGSKATHTDRQLRSL